MDHFKKFKHHVNQEWMECFEDYTACDCVENAFKINWIIIMYQNLIVTILHIDILPVKIVENILFCSTQRSWVAKFI